MGDEDRGMGYTGLGDRGLTPTEYERRELGDRYCVQCTPWGLGFWRTAWFKD